MIQRIQSIWLLLAGIAGSLMYKLPLWQYKLPNQALPTSFFAPESLLMFILVVVTTLLALATIFLFRNRGLQKSLCLLGVLLSIGILAMEVFKVEDLKKTLTPVSNIWQAGALMPVLMIILFMLARGGISRDEKVIRSLDRLR
jgi:glucan phosphoethanolaminetransferase (alkaline phosphatase superfamily)